MRREVTHGSLKTLAAAALSALLLIGCDTGTPSAGNRGGGAAPASSGSGAAPPASGAAVHPADTEKYGKDRAYCQSLATEQMKTRRTVDYGRREVFAGQMDRYGTNALPDQMYNYGDTKNYDRLVGDCMATRGYPQQPESWWNKKLVF